MLDTQRFLMSFWQADSNNESLSTQHPLVYADRVRIRQPGDAGFALGPHVDGGSVERWDPQGYGIGNVYEKIWSGDFEQYNPWDATSRVSVVSDLHNGAGACTMFRMFQGWLSMSKTGPNEGTLMVNPLLQLSTAYFLLRPFFNPVVSAAQSPSTTDFLAAKNWQLVSKDVMSSELHGASPGHGQELNTVFHPHLDLDRTMVPIPKINPGDYVAWHCDLIHAVEKIHNGRSDSSVIYIPVCPRTTINLDYLAQQRQSFVDGVPAPDFPGGEGESRHIGRPTLDYVRSNLSADGLRAMGLE